MKIQLTIGSSQAAAALHESQIAAEFASLLPVTVEMRDHLAREKAGQLPRALSADAPHQYDYAVGDVSYWPPSHDLAIFYADDGQAIPSPGLTPLGRIESGLDVIASAGRLFRLTIERAE